MWNQGISDAVSYAKMRHDRLLTLRHLDHRRHLCKVWLVRFADPLRRKVGPALYIDGRTHANNRYVTSQPALIPSPSIYARIQIEPSFKWILIVEKHVCATFEVVL